MRRNHVLFVCLFFVLFRRVDGLAVVVHDERHGEADQVYRPESLPVAALLPGLLHLLVPDVLRQVREHREIDAPRDGMRQHPRPLARDESHQRCEEERPTSCAGECRDGQERGQHRHHRRPH